METSASLRRFLRFAATVVAAMGVVLPLDARGQGISSPRDIIAGDPSAFARLLATTRPPAISAERKALVMRSLPSEGEVERLDASATAKLSALRPLLQATERESVYAYVPEIKDFTFLDGGWAVEWRAFTASYVESPGGEVKQIRGTVLGVWKKLPDGSWKAFRGMGNTESPPAGKAGRS